MKLKEASVYDLFKTFDYSMSVNETQLTFIHSLNGTGKSTMLRLLNAVFNGDVDVLKSVPFEQIEIDFFDGSQLVVENKSKIKFRMKMNDVEDDFTLEELKKLLPTTFLSAERTTIKNKDGTLLPALNTYIGEFNDKFGKIKANCDLKPPKNIIQKDEDKFIPWCLNLKAKLEYISDAGIAPNIPSDVRFPPSRYEYNANKKRYEEVVSSISEWIDENYVFAESMIIYLDIINKFFHNKEIFVDMKNTFQIRTTKGVPIPIDTLSAGEKQILIMFYEILFHSQQGSLVFIDEPEISLHISWQQQLGNILSEIGRVRDLQIIVATHSPQVIHDMWDCATELRLKRA